MGKSLRKFGRLLTITLLITLLFPGLFSGLFSDSGPDLGNALAQESTRLSTSSLSDRPTLFSRPLRLISLRVSTRWQYRRADYLFTIDIPTEAAQPLQQVTFSQIEGADYPRYSPQRTYAYENSDRNQPLNITTTDSLAERTVTVEFDPPVEPGRLVTIALSSRNPSDGTYLYDIAGSPPRTIGLGQRIGIGRLQIYQNSDRRFVW